MFRTSIAALVVATAVVPAAAAMPHQVSATKASSPSQSCSTLQTAMGSAVFAATYGSAKKCVSVQASAIASAKKSAAAACQADRADKGFAADHGGKSFARYYGGLCLERKSSKMLSTLAQHRIQAAKTCWGQRQADPTSFNARWKSFAACVAGDAKTM